MNKVISALDKYRIPRHRVDIGFELPVIMPDIEYFQKLVSKSDLFSQPQKCSNSRQKYNSRLNRGVVYYLEQILYGKDQKRVLDLGCGQGGNRTFLAWLGVSEVISLDVSSPVSDIIGDAHLLPFKSNSFDLVLATAVIEHLYNPFVAFSEIGRILEPGGYFLATASFWERWHDKSCFHFTPNGLYVLCHCSGFELLDLWSGWGFIESVMSHAIGHVIYPFASILQRMFDSVLRRIKGNDAIVRHRLRTSGSFGFVAQKNFPRI